MALSDWWQHSTSKALGMRRNSATVIIAVLALTSLFYWAAGIDERAHALSTAASTKRDFSNPWGILGLPADNMPMAQKLSILEELDVRIVRIQSGVLRPAYSSPPGHIDEFEKAGYQVGLNIEANNTGVNGATGPIKNITEFRNSLTSLLAVSHPSFLAVENEMDFSGKFGEAHPFYSGTAEDYLAELKIACEIAHESSIPCMDGGISAYSMPYVVVDYYLRLGKDDDAIRYAGYFPAKFGLVFGETATVQELRDVLASKDIDRTRRMLQGVKSQGVDFINFHWYERIARRLSVEDQRDALRRAIEVIRFYGDGLPVACNELGQTSIFQPEPSDVTMLLETMREEHVSPVIFISTIRTLAGGRVQSLFDVNGNLTPGGRAFGAFVRHTQGTSR